MIRAPLKLMSDAWRSTCKLLRHAFGFPPRRLGPKPNAPVSFEGCQPAHPSLERFRPYLTRFIAADGSREFVSFWDRIEWTELELIVRGMDSVVVTDFLTNHVTDMWLDFRFEQCSFTINSQYGELWFYVNTPNCPDAILLRVIDHFARVLREPITPSAPLVGKVGTSNISKILIKRIALDADGHLRVYPAGEGDYTYIFREALSVRWDNDDRSLCVLPSRHFITLADELNQITKALRQGYGTELIIDNSTVFELPEEVQALLRKASARL